MELIRKYFPKLNITQHQQLSNLKELYHFWNNRVNLISRNDIDDLYEHHVLHSLAIAKYFNFVRDTKILDIGTGGGFPGIPLAIFFPEVDFLLVDVIEKKTNAVATIAADLGLQNVEVKHIPAQQVNIRFDFVVCRAVTAAPKILKWSKPLINSLSSNDLPNGIIMLKGGKLEDEIKSIRETMYQIPISDYFDEAWFTEKYLLYIAI